MPVPIGSIHVQSLFINPWKLRQPTNYSIHLRLSVLLSSVVFLLVSCVDRIIFSRWALANNNKYDNYNTLIASSSSWNTIQPGALFARVDLCYPILPPLVYILVCKREANKFACNRHKLLELLHGNKLVRTESDNTTAADSDSASAIYLQIYMWILLAS